MQLHLVAIEPELAAAWRKFCGDLECVSVHEGSIFDIHCDAVVSPANSFGFMDGGIDLLYSRRFGWQVQDRLQEMIREYHHGELIVGTAEIVETDAGIPFLIAAPTMRVPMILRDSANPYLAARAALLMVKHGVFRAGQFKGRPVSEFVKSIALPGLGTGVGQVDPEVCAYQVRTAIEDVFLGTRPNPSTWVEAQTRHQKLYTDKGRDLQVWLKELDQPLSSLTIQQIISKFGTKPLVTCTPDFGDETIKITFSDEPPTGPGVYVVYHLAGEIPCYVGEAQDLLDCLTEIFEGFGNRFSAIFGRWEARRRGEPDNSCADFCAHYGVRWLPTAGQLGRLEIAEILLKTFGICAPTFTPKIP